MGYNNTTPIWQGTQFQNNGMPDTPDTKTHTDTEVLRMNEYHVISEKEGIFVVEKLMAKEES